MGYNLLRWERDQSYLMPPSMRDWLSEGHLAWFIVDAVGQMDLREFYAAYRSDGWGAAAYDPGMMVAILLYAYCLGLRSSRRIARALEEDVGFRVVVANRQPDFRTICRFRAEQEEALEELFVEVLRLCHEAGLVKLGVVALDGTKVAANAEDLELMALIDQQYLKTPFYGSRRMTAWLRNHGHQVNRKRVRRLMQLIGLEAIYRRPNTSKPNPGHKVYPYLLRGLEINRVNQVWATDITYIPMARGFLYLVAIMDWHSRYVLAWRLSNTLEVDFCVAALEEALSKGRPQIFNTDQGSQFTSEAFTSMLLAQGVQVSMDGRGRCMDNVFVERLWRSIKYEELYLKAYQNGTEARKGIGAYLAFYNQERPHQALGYRSPGQVFHAVSPQRCLLELPRALPSDEGLRDTPAVDSLILASPLS